jgi:hypothetical protein
METAEQIELRKKQIETQWEQFIDILMFAFDVEGISSEKHLKILEKLKAYEVVQKNIERPLDSVNLE